MRRPLAVITGASSGIGEVFARKLARDYELLLIARNKERLEGIAQELRALGAVAAVLDADLSDAANLELSRSVLRRNRIWRCWSIMRVSAIAVPSGSPMSRFSTGCIVFTSPRCYG